MRVRKNPWRRARILSLWVAGLVVLFAALGLAAFYILRDTNPVPKDIRATLTFSPFVIPTTSDNFKSKNFSLTRSEDDVQILSYTITSDDIEISLSEYTQPTEFTEVAEYKERFLMNVVQQQRTIQTANGTIYIGLLSKQNNAELGVMIENGLLVFLQPNKSLDETAWRRLGEALEIRKNEF